MKASVLAWAALALAVGGCTKPEFYWYRAGTTFEEIDTDYCRCEEKARQRAAEVVADDYFNDLRSPLRTPSSFDAPGDEDRATLDDPDARTAWGQLYERNAFAGCMKGKGYVQLKAHRAPSHLRTKDRPKGAIAGR